MDQFPYLPEILTWDTRTVEKWCKIAESDASNYQLLVVKFSMEDTFADGVRDTISVCLYGIPISRSDKEWVGTPLQATHLAVRKTVREYPGLADQKGS